MLRRSASVIKDLLKDKAGELVLNVGSSTSSFYYDNQSFIWADVMVPLMKRGNELINVDLKHEYGVDVTADAGYLPFPNMTFDGCICCSLLEHVEHPNLVTREIQRVLIPKGWFVGDVPSDYPYHPDPIDTMLRLHNEKDWQKFLGENFTVKKCSSIEGLATVVYADTAE